MKVAEKWKLGQAGTDNGALLLVAVNDRALRIEVGYGLEGSLTDMKTGLIIRNVISPEFKNGNYGQGIYSGVKNIAGIATNNAQIVSESVKNPKATEESGGGLASIMFLIFFLLVLNGGIGSRRRRSGGIMGPLIVGSMLSKGGRSSGSSRGFSGGSSSGGFGGFSGGGGGFGGGGASGGW